jgi:hypothetical protein
MYPVALKAVLGAKVALLPQLLAVWTLQRACIVLALVARTLSWGVGRHGGRQVSYVGAFGRSKRCVGQFFMLRLLCSCSNGQSRGTPSSAQKVWWSPSFLQRRSFGSESAAGVQPFSRDWDVGGCHSHHRALSRLVPSCIIVSLLSCAFFLSTPLYVYDNIFEGDCYITCHRRICS